MDSGLLSHERTIVDPSADWENFSHLNHRVLEEAASLAGSVLPPSRFGAGYSVGGTPLPAASAPTVAVSATSPAAPARVNPVAVTSFVAVLILGLVVAPITLPLALAAQHQIRRSGAGGGRLASAAVIISGLYLVVGAVVIGLYFYRG